MPTSNYKRLLAPPDHHRRVDVPDELVAENLARGFILDPFPDTRDDLARGLADSCRGGVAFCTASGPSMTAWPYEQLARLCSLSTCWGTNNAYNVCGGRPLPACRYLVVLDRDFWEGHREQLRGYLAATGCTPCLFHQPSEDLAYLQVAVNQGRTADTDPAYEPGRYWHGQSSGVAAVQMALHARPRVIFLLGHDCQAACGKTHGHGVRTDEELRRNYPQGKNMLPAYRVLAAHAKQLGVEIYNLSPFSAVQDFPVRPLSWAIQYAEAIQSAALGATP